MVLFEDVDGVDCLPGFIFDCCRDGNFLFFSFQSQLLSLSHVKHILETEAGFPKKLKN